MRFTEEAMEKATAEICADEKWKSIYESAPDGAKKRLRVAFWGSKYMREGEDLDEYRAERERIEREEMTREDAHYLAQRFTAEPGKAHYKELAEKIARRPMMTDEKLDAAIATMASLLSDADRVLVEGSKSRYDRCEDGYFTKEIFWKAVGGDGKMCGLVGDCFAHGHGVEPNEKLALFWFQRGAMSGNGDCCYSLAHMYEDEKSPSFDMRSAVFWMWEGLRRGCNSVKREFGHRLAMGEGPWVAYRNIPVGVGLIGEATDDDPHGYAYYYLAMCFERGVGVAEDKSEALRLYMVAKDRGHYGAPDAISRLIADLQSETVAPALKAKTKVNQVETVKKPVKGSAKGKKPTKGKGGVK